MMWIGEQLPSSCHMQYKWCGIYTYTVQQNFWPAWQLITTPVLITSQTFLFFFFFFPMRASDTYCTSNHTLSLCQYRSIKQEILTVDLYIYIKKKKARYLLLERLLRPKYYKHCDRQHKDILNNLSPVLYTPWQLLIYSNLLSQWCSSNFTLGFEWPNFCACLF